MNNTQVVAMRNLWTSVTAPVQETKTAREMALTAHTLSNGGMRAKTTDGRQWVWVTAQNCWAAV